MKFPTYKIHSLVRLFTIRILRLDLQKGSMMPLTTWGKSCAYNAWRHERISKLPLKRSADDPWRQTILHEVIYFNRRYFIYIAKWQKCYEQCMLTLSRPLAEHISEYAGLWQITAINEASRTNVNYSRKTNENLRNIPLDWNTSVKRCIQLLNQVLPPNSFEKTEWDLSYTAIVRSSFRNRRFLWQAHDMLRGRS